MKYLVIGVVLLISVLFYFMDQSNKEDAKRLKQAEIAHQQKMRREKAEALRAQMEAAKLKAQIELVSQKVKETLLESDSFQFRNQKGNCGLVNANNRMDGYTGFARYVYLPEHQMVIIESDARDAAANPQVMDGLWRSKCT